jgi:purine-binding chemotaxis protein CheW
VVTEPCKTASQQAPLAVLVVEIAGQRHGLPAADVQELQRAVALTPWPRAPEVIEGLVNLRGQVVPVLDLRRQLGLPAKAVEPTDHLVIARAGEQLVAVRVDRALELIQLDGTDCPTPVQPMPGLDCVPRLVRYGGELVPLHDLVRLLTRAEAAALAAIVPDEG